MKHGFVKVAAAAPNIKVADVEYNTEQICNLIKNAEDNKAKIVVLPELCLTGYTCQDLFQQEILLQQVKKALLKVADFTKEKDMLVFVGLPFELEGNVYNATVALNRGNILGIVTKTFLSNAGAGDEFRYFTPGPTCAQNITFEGREIPFGPKLLFQADTIEQLLVSAELGDELFAPVSPAVDCTAQGARIVVNCAASVGIVGMDAYRKEGLKALTSRLVCGYVYANAGYGESTTDCVFDGQCLIAENGKILKENNPYENEIIFSEIDISRIGSERNKNHLFYVSKERNLPRILFHIEKEKTYLTRNISKNPFVPDDKEERRKRCEEIFMIQALGLKKRLEHTQAKTAVVGISGGLDSTLALLVTAKAFEMLGKDKKDILAITMPCFGTTDRTYQNACKMSLCVGAQLREIRIADAVNIHFKDIEHDPNVLDVTYENAQARERTQVLMDVANEYNGMVIGTGDLSELALGWATFNGDHMSMYGVNASVPKTLIRHLVQYAADTSIDEELKQVLEDVLSTPVSPELLPPKDGTIAQKTEDLVGPYELHDFFMYYLLRFGYAPSKVFRIAKVAFEGNYDDQTILKWLKTFCRRFFSQQFKRSCLPDGPKVGTVGISPRGSLMMPSDACVSLWLKDLEQIK